MANGSIMHPYRMDEQVISEVSGLLGFAKLQVAGNFPANFLQLFFKPHVFTHAYQLLGRNPQRFGEDLRFYLTTVVTYFDGISVSGGIDLTTLTNSDTRRRLSEDLAVAFSSLFMVSVYDLQWHTISQIPQNTALSKKRPDFQGFSKSNGRYIYESKGTTGLASVEKFLSKALTQVKSYPEPALSKLAIVTYLCSDNRFFPSASFVVDPAFPNTVPPDRDTSILLHMEKVLEFAGFTQAARHFMAMLAARISLKSAQTSSVIAKLEKKLNDQLELFNEAISSQVALETFAINGVNYVGHTMTINEFGYKIFRGVSELTLKGMSAGVFDVPISPTFDSEVDSVFVSIASDGSIFRMAKFNR